MMPRTAFKTGNIVVPRGLLELKMVPGSKN